VILGPLGEWLDEHQRRRRYDPSTLMGRNRVFDVLQQPGLIAAATGHTVSHLPFPFFKKAFMSAFTSEVSALILSLRALLFELS